MPCTLVVICDLHYRLLRVFKLPSTPRFAYWFIRINFPVDNGFLDRLADGFIDRLAAEFSNQLNDGFQNDDARICRQPSHNIWIVPKYSVQFSQL